MNLGTGCSLPLRRPLRLRRPFFLLQDEVVLGDRAQRRMPLHRRRRRPRWPYSLLPVAPPEFHRPRFLGERHLLRHRGTRWHPAARHELEDELHLAGEAANGWNYSKRLAKVESRYVPTTRNLKLSHSGWNGVFFRWSEISSLRHSRSFYKEIFIILCHTKGKFNKICLYHQVGSSFGRADVEVGPTAPENYLLFAAPHVLENALNFSSFLSQKLNHFVRISNFNGRLIIFINPRYF